MATCSIRKWPYFTKRYRYRALIDIARSSRIPGSGDTCGGGGDDKI